jgi:hypothetical protein
VSGCLLAAAKEVYPDKEKHFINVSLCAWICRCVQKPNKFVCATYFEDKVTWWLRTGNIWNYWQQWQCMKLLTAMVLLSVWLYLFVDSIVSVLFWENLFWEHSTIVGQGSTFLREVGNGLPNDAASYTSVLWHSLIRNLLNENRRSFAG